MKEQTFTTISEDLTNRIFKSNLTMAQKTLAMYLLTKFNRQSHVACISIRKMADDLNCSTNTTRLGVNALVKAGFLEAVKHKGKGKNGGDYQHYKIPKVHFTKEGILVYQKKVQGVAKTGTVGVAKTDTPQNPTLSVENTAIDEDKSPQCSEGGVAKTDTPQNPTLSVENTAIDEDKSPQCSEGGVAKTDTITTSNNNRIETSPSSLEVTKGDVSNRYENRSSNDKKKRQLGKKGTVDETNQNDKRDRMHRDGDTSPSCNNTDVWDLIAMKTDLRDRRMRYEERLTDLETMSPSERVHLNECIREIDQDMDEIQHEIALIGMYE